MLDIDDGDDKIIFNERPEPIDVIIRKYDLTYKEVKILYNGFKQEAPSGRMDAESFDRIMRYLIPKSCNNKFARKIFQAITSEHRKYVIFNDIVSIYALFRSDDEKAKLGWVFKLFDRDNKGYIDKQQMRDFIQATFDLVGAPVNSTTIDETTFKPTISGKEIDATARCTFESLDIDNDGKISFEDFVTFYTIRDVIL